jgi:hypothetical protein
MVLVDHTMAILRRFDRGFGISPQIPHRSAGNRIPGGFCLTMVLLPLLLLCGCMTSSERDNNAKTLDDLVVHFKKSGLTIDTVQPLLPDPIKSDSAMAVQIAGRQVGLYKFNTRWKKSQDRLAKIKQAGELHIVGIRFEAMVNGSFVMIDYEKNPEKDKIVAAFKDFR